MKRAFAIPPLLALSLATNARADETDAQRAARYARDQKIDNDPFPQPDIRDDDPIPSAVSTKLVIPAKTYELGALFYKTPDQKDWSLGVFNLEMGQELRTPVYSHFYAVSTRAGSIRMYDDKSYGLSFLQDIGGGIALGRIEPEIHVGANLFEFDVFHAHWNVSSLSPRVSAELGIRLGIARIEVVAFSQYLWRWWGDNYFARGLSIGIQIDQPKMRRILP